MKAANRKHGFALVEVLIAVAVVAIALPALLFYVDRITDNTAYLKDKAIAQWIASDQLHEAALRQQLSGQTLTGSSSGEVEQDGRYWRWQMESLATPIDGVRRLEVSVFPAQLAESTVAVRRTTAEASPLVTLIGLQEQ